MIIQDKKSNFLLYFTVLCLLNLTARGVRLVDVAVRLILVERMDILLRKNVFPKSEQYQVWKLLCLNPVAIKRFQNYWNADETGLYLIKQYPEVVVLVFYS